MTAPCRCDLCAGAIRPRELHICDDCARKTCHGCVGLWTGGDDGICTACVDQADLNRTEETSPDG